MEGVSILHSVDNLETDSRHDTPLPNGKSTVKLEFAGKIEKITITVK